MIRIQLLYLGFETQSSKVHFTTQYTSVSKYSNFLKCSREFNPPPPQEIFFLYYCETWLIQNSRDTKRKKGFSIMKNP
jgi:hypothetical protein